MGLMDWFRSLAAGKPADAPAPQAPATPPATPDMTTDGDGVVAGLDFKSAIDAHMRWKVRLEKCLAGNNEEGLKVEQVSRDDQCPLGKWIHGVGGERFGNLREFQEMKMEHARFHLCAGDVLTCCLAGDKEGAEQKLRSGEYSRASERVKLFLARLYVQVKDTA
jgi:hypothetical protein